MVLLITAWYVNHHKPSVIYYANKSKSQHIKALRVQCLVFSYSTLISTAVGTFICAAVITKPQNQWHWFGDWPAEGENTREQLPIQRVLLILSECSVKLGWEDLQGAHMSTESVGLGEVVATSVLATTLARKTHSDKFGRFSKQTLQKVQGSRASPG